MRKQNLKERLINRKIKKPNPILAFFVIRAFRFLARKRNVTFQYDDEVKKYRKKQVIMIAQHASRDDFIYVFAGYNKLDMHCVVGYQNFFGKIIYNLLLHLGTIAKYLYQPDAIAVKHMLQVVKNGESLVLFPEGIQSTSGSTHPINPATMKLLTKIKLPVVLCTSHGSYFTRPRFSKIKRMGKMTFSYQLLFKESDFEQFSSEELYQKLLSKFRYNEFEYNKKERVAFKGECENIDGLTNIIYKCPNCMNEFHFFIDKNTMKCRKCGYGVRMNEYYDLIPLQEKSYFENTDLWYKWQRKEVREEVKKSGFIISSKVRVYDIDLEKLKDNPDEVGKGILTITNHLLKYTGTYKGEKVKMVFDIKNIPSLSFSPNDHSVDMYYDNNYYCFAPMENKLQVVKWMVAVEEIHNLYDEEWRKVSQDVYD